MDDVETLEERTRWTESHEPLSFSTGCNLKGVDMVYVSSACTSVSALVLCSLPQKFFN